MVYLRTTKHERSGRYVALSYVWGPHRSFLLTRDNLTELCDHGVKVSDMPRTYRDAAKVASDLGYECIWIDALCIIQDDKDDMVHELSRMHEYYQNAELVVCATMAAGVHEGFLRSDNDADYLQSLQEPHWQRVVERRLPIYDKDGRPGIAILNGPMQLYDPEGDPWNQRGWTLQERLLGGRLLLFPSTGGFLLKCNEAEVHDQNVLQHHSSDEDLTMTMLPAPQLLGQTPMDTLPVLESWMSVINSFSARQLTNPHDKLLAVAALANEYHVRFGTFLGGYIAGHWRKCLEETLDWDPNHAGEPPTERRPPYRAPSWSCLALDKAGYGLDQRAAGYHYRRGFSNDEEAYCVKVNDASITQLSPDLSFGSVSDGWLELTAPLLPVSWCRKPCHTGFELGVWYGVPPGVDAYSYVPAVWNWIDCPGLWYLGDCIPDTLEDAPNLNSSFFLMPLSSLHRPIDEYDPPRGMYLWPHSGLLLKLVIDEVCDSTKSRRTFRRVGKVQILLRTFMSEEENSGRQIKLDMENEYDYKCSLWFWQECLNQTITIV